MNGRRIPKDWQTDVAGMGEGRARARLLRRLEKLARYFAKTPLVDEEKTREIILDGFADAATEWESRPLSELLDSMPDADGHQHRA